MICSKCGYVAKDNDRFCIRCGSPLRMPEPPVKAPEAVSAPEVCAPAAAEPAAPAVEDKPEVPEMILAEDIPAGAEAEVRGAEAEVRGAEAEVKEAAAEIKEAAEPVREMPVVEDPPMPEVPVEPVRAEAPAAPVIPVKPVEPVMPVKPVEKPVKADAAAEAACADSRLEKPLSVWGYIWRIVFFSIPVLCIIPLFIMAFSSGINKNSKHFAAAVLILKLIAVLACIGILIYILLTTDPTVISNYINQTLEKLRGMAN